MKKFVLMAAVAFIAIVGVEKVMAVDFRDWGKLSKQDRVMLVSGEVDMFARIKFIGDDEDQQKYRELQQRLNGAFKNGVLTYDSIVDYVNVIYANKKYQNIPLTQLIMYAPFYATGVNTKSLPSFYRMLDAYKP
ncbi:MAG: hypothetical protein LBC07_04860 [Elusimicrobiota bacterium]|jgi:hypothetical protein|nr:hypothetical protein [Elusimicrobiota bacterium]